jgi:hypothetical protein
MQIRHMLCRMTQILPETDLASIVETKRSNDFLAESVGNGNGQLYEITAIKP